LQFDRFGDSVRFAFLSLRHDAGRLDYFAELTRAAISDGRLVRVQFNDRIIDPRPRQCREHMLYRMDLDITLGERSGSVGLGYVLDPRFYLRLALEVHATKTYARIGWRRQKGHVDPIAAVQPCARISCRPIEGLLL